MSYHYANELEQRHSAVYKTFFSQYDLVLSLPHIIRLWHSQANWSALLTIRQKLPHRLFLWMKKTDLSWFSFDAVQSFDLHQGVFVQKSPHEYFDNMPGLATACKKLLYQLGISSWLAVGLLTEYPKWQGSSFSSVFFTLLALSLFMREKKIPLETVQNYTFYHSTLFQDVCLLGSYLKYMVTWSAWTCLSFVALDPQISPLLQVWTIDFATFSSGVLQNHLWNLSRPLEWVLKTRWAYPLVNQWTSRGNWLPVDIAVIHL